VRLPEVGRFISPILSSPNLMKRGLLWSLAFFEAAPAYPIKNSTKVALVFKPRVVFLLEVVKTEAECVCARYLKARQTHFFDS